MSPIAFKLCSLWWQKHTCEHTHTYIPQTDPDTLFFLMILSNLDEMPKSWKTSLVLTEKQQRGFHTTAAMISFNRLHHHSCTLSTDMVCVCVCLWVHKLKFQNDIRFIGITEMVLFYWMMHMRLVLVSYWPFMIHTHTFYFLCFIRLQFSYYIDQILLMPLHIQ